MQQGKVTLQKLFNDLPIPLAEFARGAKVSEVTAARIRDGKPARRSTINRLLAQFSQVYGVRYVAADVEGIHYQGANAGDEAPPDAA